MFETAKKLLVENVLCDHCIGRQFALLGYGLSNKERGKIIKNALILENFSRIQSEDHLIIMVKNIAYTDNSLASNSLEKLKITFEKEKKKCELCDGLFNDLDKITEQVLVRISKEEFQSYLIGAKFLPSLIEKEDILRAKYSITTGETMKEEFTREIGKRINIRTKKEPSFNLPDITIIINLIKNEITLEKRSLYIYGRYQKLIRTIPQTKWPCWECNGKGCQKCNFTGKLYQESVEELIAEPFIKNVGGSGTKFHGAGREDIDALMLGNGRPFVLEIRNPNKRLVDLKKIQKKVNRKAKGKVKVSELEISDKKKIQKLKSLATETKKTYRAKIILDQDISEEKIAELINGLKGIEIKQKTPQRVIHRRANLERTRRVYDISIRKLSDKEIEAEITGGGGLYIKELISGDNGRTLPSFTSILGFQAKCVRLDVTRLHYD
ncbi:MAG TPA: tRNA pseudouridine(54/55) synthase Pus10 [candidate division Zixibacteria bacterium]|nr:tRNA pseudouridine(54/55) synthase Pus10 [candidate division Zixibacteria bacterium]